MFILTFLTCLIHQTVLLPIKWIESRQSSFRTSNSNRPAPRTYTEPQPRWSRETNTLSVYQEESRHSFCKTLMRKAGARQLAEVQFCLHIPRGRRARRILTSGGTGAAFAARIDYLSPGGGERSGICAAVIRCISCLWYNIDHLQTMVGMAQLLGRLRFLPRWEIP